MTRCFLNKIELLFLKQLKTMEATDYEIRYRDTCEYLKIVCNSYRFPLYQFIHDTQVTIMRTKLFQGIRLKLEEEFNNVLQNRDYKFGMERLEELRKELDALMI